MLRKCGHSLPRKTSASHLWKPLMLTRVDGWGEGVQFVLIAHFWLCWWVRTRLFEVPLHLQPPVLKGCREALWTFKSAAGMALVLKNCREHFGGRVTTTSDVSSWEGGAGGWSNFCPPCCKDPWVQCHDLQGSWAGFCSANFHYFEPLIYLKLWGANIV